jgi:hypothetical protein
LIQIKQKNICFSSQLGIIACKQISVFGSILNWNFGQNRMIPKLKPKCIPKLKFQHKPIPKPKFPITRSSAHAHWIKIFKHLISSKIEQNRKINLDIQSFIRHPNIDNIIQILKLSEQSLFLFFGINCGHIKRLFDYQKKYWCYMYKKIEHIKNNYSQRFN